MDDSSRDTESPHRTALIALADLIRDVLDPELLAYSAAEIVGRTLGVSRAGYGTVDPVAETITVIRDWNAPGIVTLAGVLHFRDYGYYIEDLKRGDTVVFADAERDPRTIKGADALKRISAQAAINMPVSEHGGFVALFYLNHATAREWSPAELNFIRDVAGRVRTAVERLRAEAALRTLNETLEQRVTERSIELEKAQAALRQAQKMEAVGQLTGGLAHDFNNLLTGISGSLQMLQNKVSQGRYSEVDRYVLAAQGAARRAAALTHRLLAFSRQQTLDPKPVDLNHLVVGMGELIQRTIGPQIEIQSVAAAGLWNTRVDPGQLENALLNLCINSRDAMPDGGKLTIETANRWLDEHAARQRNVPPGQYVSLCVSDTGTGMSPETISRAFDPFFTTKPIGMGTGLGLSMTYGFVRQSGGEVRIYSEVGDGTTVCLYLPREHASADAPAEPEGTTDATDGNKENVLIVDDEPTVRMLVADVLQEAGYTPIEADDGPAGLRIVQSNTRIDLLITDVGLPGGMNGRQLADAARSLRPDLKVLFITGYAENAVLNHGHLSPGMQVLTKPFAIETLTRRVKELLV